MLDRDIPSLDRRRLNQRPRLFIQYARVHSPTRARIFYYYVPVTGAILEWTECLTSPAEPRHARHRAVCVRVRLISHPPITAARMTTNRRLFNSFASCRWAVRFTGAAIMYTEPFVIGWFPPPYQSGWGTPSRIRRSTNGENSRLHASIANIDTSHRSC